MISRESAERESGEHQRHATHRLVILLGGALPVATAVAATLLLVSWLPELPDPIAVHWGVEGVNGFGSALPFVLFLPVFVVFFSALTVSVSWRTGPFGRPLYNQKILLTTGVWVSVFLSVVIGGTVAIQRGLSDAKDVSDPGMFLAIGAAAGFVLAAIVWFLLPKGESSIGEGGQAPKPIDVRGAERLSWSHTARLGNAGLAIVGLAFAMVIGTAIFTSLTSRPSAIIALIVLVFVAVLVVTNTWWRVTADRRGFTVRGALGWPSKNIPLHDIRTVQVVDVHPTRDFGGWGWRWTVDGRSGVILRAGPAIEVTDSSGKRFVVTVDDAETGAGVIAALLTQWASRSA